MWNMKVTVAAFGTVPKGLQKGTGGIIYQRNDRNHSDHRIV